MILIIHKFVINECNITIDVSHFAELWLAHVLHMGVPIDKKLMILDDSIVFG